MNAKKSHIKKASNNPFLMSFFSRSKTKQCQQDISFISIFGILFLPCFPRCAFTPVLVHDTFAHTPSIVNSRYSRMKMPSRTRGRCETAPRGLGVTGACPRACPRAHLDRMGMPRAPPKKCLARKSICIAYSRPRWPKMSMLPCRASPV